MLILLIVVLIVLYFVPIIVAGYRSSRHILLVAGLSLAFGWTVVGWIAGLVLALRGSPNIPQVEPPRFRD